MIYFTLLAIVDILAVQSSAQTFIHNAILFNEASNNAWYNQAHWLIGTPYLLTIASNGEKSIARTVSLYLNAFCLFDSTHIFR